MAVCPPVLALSSSGRRPASVVWRPSFAFRLGFLQGLGAPAPMQPDPLVRVGPDKSLDDGGVGLGGLANGLLVRALRRRQGIEDVDPVPAIGFAEHKNRQNRGAGLRAQ